MNRVFLLLMIAMLVALSGCEQGTAAVDINGQINATNDGFVLNAEVENTGYSSPTFTNVTVYLYRANGTVIDSKHAGTMEPSTEISLQTKEIPRYVIADSPEFWEYGDIGVSYYEYVEHAQAPDGIYSEEVVGSRDEFPVEVPPNRTA